MTKKDAVLSAKLEKLSKMSYDEIDFSDIPSEELKKLTPARLRKKNLKIAS